MDVATKKVSICISTYRLCRAFAGNLRSALTLVVFFLAPLAACGPGRAVIPPGEIPSLPYASTEDERYGQNVLRELSRQHPLSRSDNDINRARDIVLRLARSAGAANDPWHVFVLQGDSVVNAAATRGNYVFVWSGLLRLVATDGELATVLAHEIGHLLAGHTQPTAAEEASSIIAQTSGTVAGQVVASQGPYGALASVASTLVTEAIKAIAVNPESQRLELEADQIGFFLMADAAYDPQEALSVWTRMAEKDGPGSTLQFLSSHPANEERLAALRDLLPAAVARFDAARGTRSPGAPESTPLAAAREDSFSFGREEARAPRGVEAPHRQPQLGMAQRMGPAAVPIWRIVDPATPVRIAPFAEATVIESLPVGTTVVVKSRVGRFYEITAPLQGFVSTEALTPTSASTRNGGR